MLYYIRDIANNIIGLVDSNNQLVAKYSYDAFGNVLTKEGTYATKNPFLYKGYYYEHSIQLYYLESRYYDPYIRRFISPDNITYLEPTSFSGSNLYSYCGNDPVNYYDYFAISILMSLIVKLDLKIAMHYSLLKNKNHKMPNHGVPGSIGRIFYPDGRPKQEREYGPDGRPSVDHDHHPGEKVGYDHDHDWDWGKNPPRQPAREPSKFVAALGIVGTGILLVWLIGNDFTGIGIADDVLIPTTAASFILFWSVLFGGSKKV